MKKNSVIIPQLIISVIPHVVSDWLIYCLRYKNRRVLKRNNEWFGVGRGKRAWVLATGPSIIGQDLTLLAGEDCYSVSNFFLHDAFQTIAPKAHFFAPYHQPLDRENYLDWLRKADQVLQPKTSVVLGLSDYDMIERNGVFGNRKLYYLNMGARRYNKIDCTRLVPRIQTGPQMILNLLIYAGYREIYLLGCDHDTLRNYGGVVENFYDSNKDVRVNAIGEACWFPVIEHLETLIQVFKIYEKFQRENPSVRIVNCSPSSWLRFTSMKTEEFVSVVEKKVIP